MARTQTLDVDGRISSCWLSAKSWFTFYKIRFLGLSPTWQRKGSRTKRSIFKLSELDCTWQFNRNKWMDVSLELSITMTNLIISSIAAIWIGLIALLSVQNASLVSIKFIFWNSIDLPWGLVLAGAVALGFVIGGCLPLLNNNPIVSKRR